MSLVGPLKSSVKQFHTSKLTAQHLALIPSSLIFNGKQNRENIIKEILEIYETRGHKMYIENCTIYQHSLQTATFAEIYRASSALITACLLHDLGHLLYPDHSNGLFMNDQDDVHELLAEHVLRQFFPNEVTRPIALHVSAKRYCNRSF